MVSLLAARISYSGADLAGLVREAAMQALRRAFITKSAVDGESVMGTTSAVPHLEICNQDFLEALKKVVPSVSKEDEAVFKGGVFK
jgi:SpoVK/Ycf46/Vps4 family AAA+-type ATPase